MVTEVSEARVQEIIEDHEETENKEQVLNAIYAERFSEGEEPNNPYNKDRDGMDIATRFQPDEIDDEVVDVLIQIGELVDGWDRDQLDINLEERGLAKEE